MKTLRYNLVTIWMAAILLSLVCSGIMSGCRSGTASKPVPAAGTAPQTVNASAINDDHALFVDVTPTAGLNYHWEPTGKRPLNILQTIGNGCAFLDYDNDGNLDILLVGPKPALYKGDGHGHFKDVTREAGLCGLEGHFLGCAVGDYDNDGYEDIYLTAYRGGLLLHNEQGRGYRDVSLVSGIKPQPWGTSASFVDIDNDGKLDLYIGNYAVFGPETTPQLCDFHGLLSSCGPRYYVPEKGVLYHNEGKGRFRDITAQLPQQEISGRMLGVAAADFNGSGRQSLALANDEMPGDLLLNTGSHWLQVASRAGVSRDDDGNVHGGMGVDWGDYDNDGRLDLVVATFAREAKCVYHNEGQGLFADRSSNLGVAPVCMPYVAFGVKFLDYDNDGFLDLMFVNGHVQDNIDKIENVKYREPSILLHNVGGSKYEDVSAQAGSALRKEIVGRGLAVGDFDNDGKMDMLVVDSEGAPLLLHNQASNAGNWLLVKLEGVKSNHDGIGALVTVEAGGRKLLRRCATDGSYMSASDRRVHFGLGDFSGLVTVTVRWPGGRQDRFASVRCNREATFREGASRSGKDVALAVAKRR